MYVAFVRIQVALYCRCTIIPLKPPGVLVTANRHDILIMKMILFFMLVALDQTLIPPQRRMCLASDEEMDWCQLSSKQHFLGRQRMLMRSCKDASPSHSGSMNTVAAASQVIVSISIASDCYWTGSQLFKQWLTGCFRHHTLGQDKFIIFANTC